MGIEEKGQVCVMIHSGSRGFGHQVATGKSQLNHDEMIRFRFFLQLLNFRCFGINGKSDEAGQNRDER